MHKKLSHIVFFLDYYLPYQGGAEKVFARIIEKLLVDHIRVTVITTAHTDGLPQYEQDGLLNIYRIGQKRAAFRTIGWHKSAQILKQLATSKNPPQIIHTSPYSAAFPARFFARLYRIPVTITIHEFFGSLRKVKYPLIYPLYQAYERMLSKLPYKKIIAVSRYTQSIINQYTTKQNTTIIYNGIDKQFSMIQPRSEKSGSNAPITALYFGHCGFSKGIDTYINAIPTIATQFPNTQFVFSLLESKNTPSIYKTLTVMSKKYPITLYQSLPQEKIISLIEQVSVVVVPSRSEGFGLAAAESSAAQKPLITTKYGAIPEVVFGNVLFLEDFTPQAYCNARNRLLQGDFTTIPKKEFDRNETYKQYKHLWDSTIN